MTHALSWADEGDAGRPQAMWKGVVNGFRFLEVILLLFRLTVTALPLHFGIFLSGALLAIRAYGQHLNAKRLPVCECRRDHRTDQVPFRRKG
jgi:hypothetical protein